MLAEDAHRLVGRGVGEHRAVVEDDGAVADRPDLVGVVRDEQDRPPLLLEGPDPVQALGLELLVADGQDLVDDEHVGVDVDGDREAEPDVHARGVELHLGVDELAQYGTCNMPGEAWHRRHARRENSHHLHEDHTREFEHGSCPEHLLLPHRSSPSQLLREKGQKPAAYFAIHGRSLALHAVRLSPASSVNGVFSATNNLESIGAFCSCRLTGAESA